MSITSPKHSFVSLDERLENAVMPIYDHYAIAFQYLYGQDDNISMGQQILAGIGAITKDNVFVLNPLHEVINVCSWAKITGIDLVNGFPITVIGGQFIPEGPYNSAEELYLALSEAGMACTGPVWLECCYNNITNMSIVHSEGTIIIQFKKGLQQVTIPKDADTLFEAIGVNIGDCFRFVVARGSFVTYSNPFQRVGSNKHLSWITYNCNESAYGFRYPYSSVINQIWLPVYTRHPKFPEQRKVYMKSDKTYKVLHASIEKEWEMVTDRMTQDLHERITVMLAHDNIQMLNNSIDSYVFKKDEYTIDWSDRSEEAVAKCKLLTPFEGRNSNCEKRETCCDVNLAITSVVEYELNADVEYDLYYTQAAAFDFLEVLTSVDGGINWQLAAQTASSAGFVRYTLGNPIIEAHHVKIIPTCGGRQSFASNIYYYQ